MLHSLALLSLLTSPGQSKPAAQDALERGFVNPPASARPHTWWHWMDGNVTKEGLTADLEAMKQVGIGGAQMFTVSQDIPKGPVDYMSPKWREMTAHAVKEATRLGIELCIHNCAGWSSSGGPWITPENAMQVIAWSNKKVQGPTRFSEVLPEAKAPSVSAKVDYYRDIAVYAFPTVSEGDVSNGQANFLGRTGVIRQDGLVPDFSPGPAGLAVAKNNLIDLTGKLDAKGKLTWDVPAGNWTILRMGHVPTGKDNHPAPPEGDGLEVDKLSREAMDTHWDGMMAKVLSDIGPLAGKSLNNALIDSYEVHGQNWTPKFRAEFQKRRGYDPMPYLPTIAGLTIESKEITERFLWDFRRTIADLFADNYYAYFGELCHKAGLQFSTEPYGDGNFDNLQAGGHADIPMGEFWINNGPNTIQTTKVASSVGHVYGRPVIGAESFTADEQRGKWLEEPYAVKTLGDLIFTNGVNRYIFHRYAHQPWMNLKPGMTMGPWGTHLERTQTWWTEAAAWMKYIARCQYLLQKGTFVADVLYCTGESAPVDMAYGSSLNPIMPTGYDYDACDASVVLKQLKVRDGKLVLPSGMVYRILVMPDSKFMTPEMAAKIAELVKAGATVVAPKPEHSPSLVGYPNSDAKVKAIAAEVWGEFSPTQKRFTHQVGKGSVNWNYPLAQMMASRKVIPDFSYKSLSGGSKLVYIHRKIQGAETYFVSNQKYGGTVVDCSFRVTDKLPELWHPETGKLEPAPVYRVGPASTSVNLRLGPAESVFVVFRKKENGVSLASFAPRGMVPTVQPAPKITIKSAHYETADGRGTDVTEKVRELLAQGEVEIAATNGNFGDPVVNVVKRLRVVYELNGRETTKVVPENEMLELASVPVTPVTTLDYQLASSPTGFVLTPWRAAVYEGMLANGKAFTVNVQQPPQMLMLAGSWHVKFPAGWGAPPSAEFKNLTSWSENANPGIKYFSGSAIYSRTFNVSPSMVGKNRALMLDLGKVKNFATVRLNGKELAVLWMEPFALDVTNVVKVGENKLEIKITNLWPNRIIGDEQLPADVKWRGASLQGWPEWLKNGQEGAGQRPKTGRYTFATWRYFNKDSKLLESGLMGPVILKSTKKVAIPNR